MKSFDAAEFEILWNIASKFLLESYIVGLGHKSQHTAKDVLLLTLTVLKYSGQWDFLAEMLNLKESTFERLITRFIELLSTHLFESLVLGVKNELKMSYMLEDGHKFKNFPFARYATDLTFQQSDRPSKNMQEKKFTFQENINYTDFK